MTATGTVGGVFDDVLAGLPPTSRQLLTASYFRAVRSSPDDEEVFFEDVLVSVDRLRDRGADVTVRALPGFDHLNSWIQAMPRAARYFRTLDSDLRPAS